MSLSVLVKKSEWLFIILRSFKMTCSCSFYFSLDCTVHVSICSLSWSMLQFHCFSSLSLILQDPTHLWHIIWTRLAGPFFFLANIHFINFRISRRFVSSVPCIINTRKFVFWFKNSKSWFQHLVLRVWNYIRSISQFKYDKQVFLACIENQWSNIKWSISLKGKNGHLNRPCLCSKRYFNASIRHVENLLNVQKYIKCAENWKFYFARYEEIHDSDFMVDWKI